MGIITGTDLRLTPGEWFQFTQLLKITEDKRNMLFSFTFYFRLRNK
jgi:hypothetical protein